jgi:hypothetical protein
VIDLKDSKLASVPLPEAAAQCLARFWIPRYTVPAIGGINGASKQNKPGEPGLEKQNPNVACFSPRLLGFSFIEGRHLCHQRRPVPFLLFSPGVGLGIGIGIECFFRFSLPGE